MCVCPEQDSSLCKIPLIAVLLVSCQTFHPLSCCLCSKHKLINCILLHKCIIKLSVHNLRATLFVYCFRIIWNFPSLGLHFSPKPVLTSDFLFLPFKLPLTHTKSVSLAAIEYKEASGLGCRSLQWPTNQPMDSWNTGRPFSGTDSMMKHKLEHRQKNRKK